MAADIHYPVTSASVANGSNALTITGNLTSWLKPNHKFGNQAGTCWAVIDSVGAYAGGVTPVTLAENWGGTSLVSAAAQIEITNEGQALAGKVVTILNLLNNGILQAIAGLTGAADNDVIQRKSGQFTNRTMLQLSADLGLLTRIVPTTGFSYQIPNACTILVLNQNGTLASGTLQLPASPIDRQRCRISSPVYAVTSLTITTAATGIAGNVTTLAAGSSVEFIYDASVLWWYRIG